MRSIVTISLPPDVAKELTRAAKRLRVPKSQFVRRAVERALAAQRFEELRAELAPAARKAGIVTDDDVFNRIS